MSKHGVGGAVTSLTLASDGIKSRLLLDGQDFSRAVTGVTLRVEPGCSPVAVLDVLAFEAEGQLDDPEIQLPEPTRALLLKLGWTPPTVRADSDEEVPDGVD